MMTTCQLDDVNDPIGWLLVKEGDEVSLEELVWLKLILNCEKSSQSYTATPKVDMSMIELNGGDYNYDSRLEVGKWHETHWG